MWSRFGLSTFVLRVPISLRIIHVRSRTIASADQSEDYPSYGEFVSECSVTLPCNNLVVFAHTHKDLESYDSKLHDRFKGREKLIVQ